MGCDSWSSERTESAQNTETPTTRTEEDTDPYPKLYGFARDKFDNYNRDTVNSVIVAQIAYDGQDRSADAILEFLFANGVPRDKASKEGSGITILAYVPVWLLGRLSQLEEVELVVEWVGREREVPGPGIPAPPTVGQPSIAEQPDADGAADAGLEFTPDYEKLGNLADVVRGFATAVAQGSASVEGDPDRAPFNTTIMVFIYYDEEKSSGRTIVEFLIANGFSDEDFHSDNYFDHYADRGSIEVRNFPTFLLAELSTLPEVSRIWWPIPL